MKKYPYLSQLVPEEALTTGTFKSEELAKVEKHLADTTTELIATQQALLSGARIVLTPDEFMALIDIASSH